MRSPNTFSDVLVKHLGRKLHLTPVMSHPHWTLAEWKGVLFSDECTIGSLYTMHIRLSLGKRFDNKYVVAKMKHLPSQMMWGAVSCCSVAGLYLCFA